MQLPFTHAQFLDVFGAYNLALWPLVALLWLATLASVLRLYWQRSRASRTLIALLAFHWAWAGALYHIGYFREINPAAAIFGIAFIVQAGLLIWRGLGDSPIELSISAPIWGRIGAGLMLYALAYPALGLLFGLQYPRLPTFGVPCPLAIFTAGVLLLMPRRDARPLAVIPVLWSFVGGSAAFVLGIRADLMLPVAGLVLLIYSLAPARQTGGRAT